MTACPNCGYSKPRRPQGRPALYDVSDLDVGGQRAFTYRDTEQRNSIRNSLNYSGRRDHREYLTRLVAPGILEVTRTA